MSANLILYDGHCPFCHFWLKGFLWADRKGKFSILSLQAEGVDEYLSQLGSPGMADRSMESVICVRDGKVHEKSDAVIECLSALGGAWILFRIFRWIPAKWRDSLYTCIAERRYTWFGRYEACPLPPARYRKRFLDRLG